MSDMVEGMGTIEYPPTKNYCPCARSTMDTIAYCINGPQCDGNHTWGPELKVVACDQFLADE